MFVGCKSGVIAVSMHRNLYDFRGWLRSLSEVQGRTDVPGNELRVPVKSPGTINPQVNVQPGQGRFGVGNGRGEVGLTRGKTEKHMFPIGLPVNQTLPV